MIVEWLLSGVWGLINFILRFFPQFPAVAAISGAVDYISYVFTQGADIFFLFVPYTAFKVAIDVLFFFWTYEPISMFVMWIIRKIPFLGME